MELSIAIPDSSLVDESTQIDKTRKISLIARACAIFKVKTIFIYHESAGTERDKSLLRVILKYLETPQYLRRSLFPKISELKFAGMLSPLKIPHHNFSSDTAKVKAGDVRDGVVFYSKGSKFVDAGFGKPIPYFGNQKDGSRITIKFKSGFPNVSIKEISKDEISLYWGYEVKESASLQTILSNWNSHVILTSKKGKIIHKTQKYFDEIANNQVLVVFGSPQRGLHEILGNKINQIPKSQILNLFPGQATETVRLEEAILGSLAILNVLTNN